MIDVRQSGSLTLSRDFTDLCSIHTAGILQQAI